MTIRGRTARLLMSVVLGITAAIVPAGVAKADTFYPAGCERYVRHSWADTCWVGYNYIDDGTAVLGVQWVLIGALTNPGTPDCDFGPRTDAATIEYQRKFGLTRDGIVGTQTWGSMQGRLTYSGIDDVYGSYFNNGYDGLRFYVQLRLPTGNGYWHVLDDWADPPGYVAMSDFGEGTNLCPF